MENDENRGAVAGQLELRVRPQPKRDDVASRWRVRFALPDGYFTFVDVGAPNGSPLTKATVWHWGEGEVRDSKGEYLGVSSVYSIDHEA